MPKHMLWTHAHSASRKFVRLPPRVKNTGAWHSLMEAVSSGLLSQAELDTAVSRVLAGRCERGALTMEPPEDMPWQDLGLDQVGWGGLGAEEKGWLFGYLFPSLCCTVYAVAGPAVGSGGGSERGFWGGGG
jgi:hypothetical protein